MEASRLEGSLFGCVLNVRIGLDSVRHGRGEEVLSEQPLGQSPMASAPVLRKESDSDLPCDASLVRPVRNTEPSDVADGCSICHYHDPPVDDERSAGRVVLGAIAEPVVPPCDFAPAKVLEEWVITLYNGSQLHRLILVGAGGRRGTLFQLQSPASIIEACVEVSPAAQGVERRPDSPAWNRRR
jgi:hypothetical protein